jgi:hypothetical protein
MSTARNLILTAVVGAALAGCSSMGDRTLGRTATGAAIGGAVGAGVGAAVGGVSTAEGAIAGAVVGGVAGAATSGNSGWRRDRRGDCYRVIDGRRVYDYDRNC